MLALIRNKGSHTHQHHHVLVSIRNRGSHTHQHHHMLALIPTKPYGLHKWKITYQF
ncbi:hypothetical protein T484DRAFT_1971764 [Baffinella frigidus]|nr:hypothetical protein T484DRAFT_1971764 [Cryptophyta sp. CCMP2293]